MGLFSRFFKKKSDVEPVDLAAIGIDLHSHLLPGIDDGAQTIEDSLELIRQMILLGYKKAITTPHVMADSFKNTPAIIHQKLKELRQALSDAEIDFRVEAAAEYYLDYEFEDKVKTSDILTFGDRYVLFELPFIAPPESLSRVIFEMQTCGYKPVLAHPERYPFYYRDFTKLEDMKEKGVLMQVNINSLSGHYSLETKRLAEKLVDAEMVDFAGSDCHHFNHLSLLDATRSNPHLHKLVNSGKLLNHTL